MNAEGFIIEFLTFGPEAHAHANTRADVGRRGAARRRRCPSVLRENLFPSLSRNAFMLNDCYNNVASGNGCSPHSSRSGPSRPSIDAANKNKNI